MARLLGRLARLRRPAAGPGHPARPADAAGGALAVAGIAVLQAFLFDLGELEGLYRAASFLGLGLCLIAIGWLYRRFVVPRPAGAPP